MGSSPGIGFGFACPGSVCGSMTIGSRLGWFASWGIDAEPGFTGLPFASTGPL